MTLIDRGSRGESGSLMRIRHCRRCATHGGAARLSARRPHSGRYLALPPEQPYAAHARLPASSRQRFPSSQLASSGPFTGGRMALGRHHLGAGAHGEVPWSSRPDAGCPGTLISPAIGTFADISARHRCRALPNRRQYAEKVAGSATAGTVAGCRRGRIAGLVLARYPRMPLEFNRVCAGFQAVILGEPPPDPERAGLGHARVDA
jgi:hypothetical protein